MEGENYVIQGEYRSIFVVQLMYSLATGQRRERTIGWYENMAEAQKNLVDNSLLFSESVEGVPYYRYALIEEVPKGPFAISMVMKDPNIKFFEFKNGKYEGIPTPKSLKGVIGFTMG